MYKLIFGVCLIFFWCENASAHTYSLGKCPDVEPMSNFDMKRVKKKSFYVRENIFKSFFFNCRCWVFGMSFKRLAPEAIA